MNGAPPYDWVGHCISTTRLTVLWSVGALNVVIFGVVVGVCVPVLVVVFVPVLVVVFVVFSRIFLVSFSSFLVMFFSVGVVVFSSIGGVMLPEKSFSHEIGGVMVAVVASDPVVSVDRVVSCVDQVAVMILSPVVLANSHVVAITYDVRIHDILCVSRLIAVKKEKHFFIMCVIGYVSKVLFYYIHRMKKCPIMAFWG